MRKAVTLLLLAFVLMGVSSAQSAPAPPTPQPGAQTASPQPSDELSQMRDDLNKLESLNLNMSSEIEFLRDQNLQILLRTNVQMWTVLIRDLRQQVQREEQRRAMPPRPADHSSATKPDR
jgi:TolA-binding protein